MMKGHDSRGKESAVRGCVQPSFSLFPGDGRAAGRSGDRRDGHDGIERLMGCSPSKQLYLKSFVLETMK